VRVWEGGVCWVGGGSYFGIVVEAGPGLGHELDFLLAEFGRLGGHDGGFILHTWLGVGSSGWALVLEGTGQAGCCCS
jgi:hypothetical protein